MTEKLARKRTGAFCHHTPLKGRDDAPARERPESRGVSEPDSPRSAMAYVIMRALRVNMEPCKPQCTPLGVAAAGQEYEAFYHPFHLSGLRSSLHGVQVSVHCSPRDSFDSRYRNDRSPFEPLCSIARSSRSV